VLPTKFRCLLPEPIDGSAKKHETMCFKLESYLATSRINLNRRCFINPVLYHSKF